jgi:hypothetical protein
MFASNIHQVHIPPRAIQSSSNRAVAPNMTGRVGGPSPLPVACAPAMSSQLRHTGFGPAASDGMTANLSTASIRMGWTHSI